MLPDDGTPNHLEIWLDGNSVGLALPMIELTLAPPTGTATMVSAPGDGYMQLLETGGRAIAGVYFDVERQADGSDRARIHISVNGTASYLAACPAPAGRWRLTVVNKFLESVTARLYIQRDDTPIGHPLRGRQSHFDHPGAYERRALDGSYCDLSGSGPITSTDTLSAIATGAGSLVVGAADSSRRPADYTASGPARSRQGPDCAATTDLGPAHWGLLAAGTYSGSVVAMRGTSVAAPQLVRKVADYLESRASNPVAVASNLSDHGGSAPPDSPGEAALQAIAGTRANALSAGDLRRLGGFLLRERIDPTIPQRIYQR
jgi:hypothetical protein